MIKPGTIIKTFTTKSGKEIVLRTPTSEDLDALLAYINELSKEDTFITFSGEIITREEEEKFLTTTLDKMGKGDTLMICAFYNNLLIGNCGVDRRTISRQREKHLGIVGISLRKQFRGDGIGKVMLQALLDTTKAHYDFKLLTLDVYGINAVAISLYQQLGFQEYGRLPKGVLYKGEYIDKVEMYLAL